MIKEFKRFLVGQKLDNSRLKSEKFSPFWGLPVLSSDAISSVAYAGEAILMVLIPVLGSLSYQYMFYASLCIVILLGILVFSYRQTIDSYPNGGGSYIVAKDNLGTIPGLVAGASLSIDYILTVAVSICAGTAAITSAFPFLYNYRIVVSIFIVAVMTLGNLRGISDSSKLFGVPTYLFILCTAAMIIVGIVKVHIFGYNPVSEFAVPHQISSITIFLFLKAFASGCTALTGVEAVSNGIPNFKEPSQKNAKKVLFLLAITVLFIFGGISYLATLYHAVPVPEKTVVSQIATQVFGSSSFMFYAEQVTTSLILIMAANTAYADLPLLLSILARDGFAPRQFTKRGDRLSFSNGILLLFAASSILIIIFKGDTGSLLPLYAVGVFISFTLSQTGMFIRWFREKQSGWRHKSFINGFGAVITFITVVIIGITKFMHGAWIVCLLIPFFISVMMKIKKHYDNISDELSLTPEEVNNEIGHVAVKDHTIVLVDSLNKSSLKSISYAKALFKNESLVAFHVSIDEEEASEAEKRWAMYGLDIPLIVRYSPHRDILGTLTDYIDNHERDFFIGDIITIVIPQFIVRHPAHNILHNQTSHMIRHHLLRDRHLAVVTVPFVLDK